MGELERMVILPETRSGRMKLRWVNWLTNWITSVRSRLSNDITTVRALVCTSFLSIVGKEPGSVARVAVGWAGACPGEGEGAFGVTVLCGVVVIGGRCACCCCCCAGPRTPGFTKRLGGRVCPCGGAEPSLAASCARSGATAKSAASGSTKGQRTWCTRILLSSLDGVGLAQGLAAPLQLDLDAVCVTELLVDLQRLVGAVHLVAINLADHVPVLDADLRIERVGDDGEQLEAVGD